MSKKFIFLWSASGSTEIEAETLEEAQNKWGVYELTHEDFRAADFECGEVLAETSPGIFEQV